MLTHLRLSKLPLTSGNANLNVIYIILIPCIVTDKSEKKDQREIANFDFIWKTSLNHIS